MLGFTHQSKNTGSKWIDRQPNFEPIIITNKLPKQVSPRKQQKFIAKVSQNKKQMRQTSKDQLKITKQKQQNINKNDWNSGGFVKGAFDKNLRKNELAAEQRRLRAELKKQKQLNHQQIIINEKKIGTKAFKMMRQKDEQIQYLKQMIQREKQQKAKIDKLYEQRKQQIERQRQQLIQLQRKIQKEGIKQKKVIQQIKKLNSPQKDIQQASRSRGKFMTGQLPPSRQIVKQQLKKSYQQPTQSQALHQKNVLRQKQLDYLMNQRQKALKGMPNINYSPTIIPLLSKASYKIVSTHVSQIVQLLVDELLEEQVYLLQQIQLQEAKQREQRKAKQVLNQYCQMVVTFAQENDQIAHKVGKYSTMNFADIYKPKYYPESQKRSGFSYDAPNKNIFKRISLQDQFDDDRMEQIQNRQQRFIRFVSNFDQYKKPNMDMFSKVTEQIINEAIQKLAKELDKGSGQFVDIVFRNQFN